MFESIKIELQISQMEFNRIESFPEMCRVVFYHLHLCVVSHQKQKTSLYHLQVLHYDLHRQF